jgi:hypothetical protein
MRNGVIATILVVVIVASAGLGYSIGVTTKQLPCDTAPSGSVLYVRITQSVTRIPVTNATIDAIPVETCHGIDTTIAILEHPTVNATGVARLDASFDTYYSVTVHYGGQVYPLRAYVQHSLTTCADINVPSGSLSVAPC